MKRKAMWWLVAVMVLLGCGVAAAQDKETPKAAEDTTNFYKLEFTLQEFDGAKLVNTRLYSINLRTGKNEWEQLRTGTRVPLPFENSGGKSVQYFDVGVNLDCRGSELARGLALQVRSDISSLPADAPGTYSPGQGPMVRQVKNDSWVVLQPGKSAMLFTADEPATARRFEMVVKATKL